MPIYEYQCDGCEAVFEVYQKVSDPAPASHSCGSDKVHRILSNTSFVLKGTGWYATDYADKSKKTSDDSAPSKAHKKTETVKDSGSSAVQSAADKPKSGGNKPSGTGSAKA